MFYDPLSVSNEEENAQNILCINDHRQWASQDVYDQCEPRLNKANFVKVYTNFVLKWLI
jgi:hypothetical protein